MRTLRFGQALALATAALGESLAQAAAGGAAAERAQAGPVAGEGDRELDQALAALIASAEIGPDGRMFIHTAPGDPRFLEPGSGRYWQISGEGHGDFRSRSLGERRLEASGSAGQSEPLFYDSGAFANEPLRVAERTVRLPGSAVDWRFIVARARGGG